MDDPWAIYTDRPRAWQAAALPVAMEAIRSRRHSVLQATTGAGKTRLQVVILSEILKTLRAGWVCVVSVPRQSLVVQTTEEIRATLGEVAGEWYGRRKWIDRVIVCCHQSAGTLADELAVRSLRVAFWMADECHRADTEDMIAAVERWSPATRLGITATPFRSAECDALRGWSDLCYRYTIDQAVDDGVLVPPRFVLWGGDEDEDANVASIEMIRDYAPAGPGIVSATDTADADWFAEQLVANGIAAESIHSRQPRDDRDQKLARLLEGAIRCLVHVDLLTEGVDIPPLRWLAMRRPRSGAVGIVQEVGRFLRTLSGPDRWGEKAEAVILLPHATPVLASMSRGAALTTSLLREAAERELEPAERQETMAESMLPLAVACADLDQWIDGLCVAAREQGVLGPASDHDGPVNASPTGRQVRALRGLVADRRKSPARHLPKPHREAIYELVDRPEGMTYCACRSLIGLLDAMRRMGWTHKRNTGQWWGGLREGLPPVPVREGAN